MSILNIFRDIKKEYSIDVCIKVPMVKARYDCKYNNALINILKKILKYFVDNYDYNIPVMSNYTQQYYLNYQINNLIKFIKKNPKIVPASYSDSPSDSQSESESKSNIIPNTYQDGFYIIDKQNDKYTYNKVTNIDKNVKFRIIAKEISKDGQPSIIEISYLNCSFWYKRTNIPKYGYLYTYKSQHNFYIPVDEMLRYSQNGKVTEDYRPCRITLYGNKSTKPFTLSIEEPLHGFDSNLKKFRESNLKNYSFDFKRQCYCTQEYTQDVKIIVNNDRIISIKKIKKDRIIKRTKCQST